MTNDALLEALVADLDRHREHVLAGIEGLGERDLDVVVAPSGWTLRGLLGHLLHDVELFWMSAVLGGDATAIAGLCDGWSAPGAPGDELRAEYREAGERGNRRLRAVDLAAAPAWWPPPEIFGGPRLASNLDVVLRVLDETATHAGHLDLARERLDGRQHLVVT